MCVKLKKNHENLLQQTPPFAGNVRQFGIVCADSIIFECKTNWPIYVRNLSILFKSIAIETTSRTTTSIQCPGIGACIREHTFHFSICLIWFSWFSVFFIFGCGSVVFCSFFALSRFMCGCWITEGTIHVWLASGDSILNGWPFILHQSASIDWFRMLTIFSHSICLLICLFRDNILFVLSFWPWMHSGSDFRSPYRNEIRGQWQLVERMPFRFRWHSFRIDCSSPRHLACVELSSYLLLLFIF